jgi:hypothetical protein
MLAEAGLQPRYLALRGRLMTGWEARVQPGEPRTDHVFETDS